MGEVEDVTACKANENFLFCRQNKLLALVLTNRQDEHRVHTVPFVWNGALQPPHFPCPGPVRIAEPLVSDAASWA